MDKNTLLAEIKKAVDTGALSYDDVKNTLGIVDAVPVQVVEATPAPQAPKVSEEVPSSTGQYASGQHTVAETNNVVARVLYGIGTIIAVVGVAIILIQYWGQINPLTRIGVTLGISIATYVLGFVVSTRKNQNALSQTFFTISAILAPVGSFVLCNELGITFTDGAILNLTIMIVLTLIFGLALYTTRKSVLYVVEAVFFSWAYFAGVTEFIKGSGYSYEIIKNVYAYAGMVLGMMYFIFSLWLHEQRSTPDINSSILTSHNESTILGIISRRFVAFSFILFLGSALFLTGFWDVLFVFLVLAAIGISIHLRTTSGLIISAFALGIYIIKISFKYFSNSIGWAFLLVLIGFIFISLGYLTFYLNKKYITQNVHDGKN